MKLARHPVAGISPMAPDLARGLTVWLTGLPSSGKTTLATAIHARLVEAGFRTELLDGDVVRTRLTRDLGFSREDRIENVRRIGFVAHLLSRNGVVCVCSVISPYREARDEVRSWHGDRFFEVWVDAPVSVCAERDVKGLYARQRSGQLSGLTGVDDPYEPPLAPEWVVRTHEQSVQESVDDVWQALVGEERQAATRAPGGGGGGGRRAAGHSREPGGGGGDGRRAAGHSREPGGGGGEGGR